MTEILIYSTETIEFLAKELQNGELVAIPTETVYGLAGNAYDNEVVKKIYLAKNRPSQNPLIAHYHDIAQAQQDVLFTEEALNVAAYYWPGPLTLVLSKNFKCKISNIATCGLATAAIRVPNHPYSLELLKRIDFPLVAPSANISGSLSPVNAEQVYKSLKGKIKWILDGGKAIQGLESTIINMSSSTAIILRPGIVTAEDIYDTTKIAVEYGAEKTQIAIAPGMNFPHYAPKCPLRLSTNNPKPGEALLAFGPANIPEGFSYVLNLSESADLKEAASNLFAHLHTLEDMGVSSIAVMPIPHTGIGTAINEKLIKAAEAKNNC